MFKDNVLTINYDTWKRGIAPSPIVGLGDLRNADVFSEPGALLCARKAIKESATTVTDRVEHMVFDAINNTTYALDNDGNVYTRSTGGTWALLDNDRVTDAGGLMVWKNHLFVAGGSEIDVYDIDADSWTSGWQTFSEGSRDSIPLPHTMLIGQDDVLYITDGIYIASITEAAGSTFDPASGATYTFNAEALDLPENYVANTLNNYADGILIGTYYGPSLNRGNRADTFFWESTSDAGTYTFNDTKEVRGNGVWQSITQGNVFYQVIDREFGSLYRSNLSEYQIVNEFKNVGIQDYEFDLYPGAIDIVDDQILFGLGSDNSSATNLGLYGLKNGLYHLQNTVSVGDTAVEVSAVCAVDSNKYLIAWEHDGTYGVDVVDEYRMDGYGTVMETPLYTVGTPLNTKQFQTVDIQLAAPLASGHGVRLSYRSSLSDSYTTMGTYDFDTYGAVASINANANMSDLSKCQIKVELTTGASASNTPKLMEINVY